MSLICVLTKKEELLKKSLPAFTPAPGRLPTIHEAGEEETIWDALVSAVEIVAYRVIHEKAVLGWNHNELVQAIRWLYSIHLHASDNPITRRDLLHPPHCLGAIG